MYQWEELKYVNYHKHSMYSNLRVRDSVEKPENYAIRTAELNNQVHSSVEHGFPGFYINDYELAKKYNLKFLFGAEAYFVISDIVSTDDESEDSKRDKTNAHLILLAKNENGRKSINKILSNANINHFHYQPRITLDDVLSLPNNDVWITTACFESNMIVTTKDGYKQIKDVTSEDYVLTHSGTWEKVVSPTRRIYDGNMCELTIEGCYDSIKCTETHEYPVLFGNSINWKKAMDLTTEDRILSVCDTYNEWNDIEELDVLNIINEYRHFGNLGRKNKHTINKNFKINDELLFILGLFVTEGSYIKNNCGICFSLHENELDLIKRINDFSKEYIGIDCNVRNKKDSKAIDVTIPCKELALIFRELVTSGSKNKNVPKFVSELPPYKQMSFVKGVVAGDGHLNRATDKPIGNMRSSNTVSFVTVSLNLAYGVRDIFERNNIKVGCFTTRAKTDKDKVNHSKSFTLQVSGENFYNYWETFENSNNWYCYDWDECGTNVNRRPVIIEGKTYIAKRVKKISTYYYNDYVYCLNIDNIHSFKIDGVNVHNCIAGIWKYGTESIDIVKKLKNHFGDNFFLEVQYHDVDRQKELNKKILSISKQLNIPIIMGCDSHYIDQSTAWERDDFLKSNNINYPEESGFYSDYPTTITCVKRFKMQNVLTDEEIYMAINNTNIFNNVEEYNSDIFRKDIKMPTLYPQLSQYDRNMLFCNIVLDKWKDEKNNIPKEKWEYYESEIKKELKVIIETGHADYFLLNYEVIKKGVENGGIITPSGRGSGPSFVINKLLGFTKIDRISAPVKMYPERFMSKTRIIESKSLADIDHNVANQKPFENAIKELLGDNHVALMCAFGTLKPKNAWRLYARANDIDFETSTIISNQIEKYETDMKYYKEDEGDEPPNVLDYIEDEYQEIFLKSEKYLGIVSEGKRSPCANLIYANDIPSEIGLIKFKENICCLVDGHWAEDYKFLKEDILKVASIQLIYRVFDRINMKVPEVNELIELCEQDDKTWDIYKNGYVMGINQVEKNSTRNKVMRYAPHNISEISAFIAAIRPGFKSEYNTFENREEFKYGIKAFDKLIQTPEMPHSFVLYQEQSMASLNYAGIPMDECYDIIKAISKKKIDKIMSYKDAFLNGFANKIMEEEDYSREEADLLAHRVWQILEDSSRYSFNACISGKTIIKRLGTTYKKFIPTVAEMYMIMNSKEYAIRTGHYSLYKKYQKNGYGNALSMFDDNKIHVNKIVNIYQSGVRNTYKVVTENNKSIVCTMNHKFPTPNGDKKLEDLQIGDYLYIMGEYEINNSKHGFTDGNFKSNVPMKGQKGFQNIDDGNSVKFNKLKKFYADNKCNCSMCDCEFNEEKRFELHHKDKDRTNNNDDNLQWVCTSCHRKIHYGMNRKKVFEKGIPTYLDKIISIEFIENEMVYDIEMEHPAHNFISESGLITSNSHSFSMAVDSLYGAYLKSHYPLEFYEVFLNLLMERGEKDRANDTKKEAYDAFGIKIEQFKFRQDNRQFTAIKENNSISDCLKAIKGFGDKVAIDLYELKDKKYSSFIELLDDLQKTSLNETHIESLIILKYFEEFGKNKTLLGIWTYYKLLRNVKQIKIEQLDKYGITEELISKYSLKKTEKLYKEIDNIGLLNDIISKLGNEPLNIKTQTIKEMEILGFIKTINEDIPSDWFFVQEMKFYKNPLKPYLTLYNLKDGYIINSKIKKEEVFAEQPFKELSFIRAVDFQKKNKTKKIGTQWVKIDEMELIIEKFDLLG